MKFEIRKSFYLTDFTQSHYFKILRLAKEKYEFCSFTNFKKSKKCIILRHDIDASVPAALEIAKIENSLKISATYFILLHSPWYNLLEEEQAESVKEIIKNRHSIGLHFDSLFYNIRTEKELVKYLNIEKDFLQKIFNVEINAFAFHNPDSKCLKFDKWKYAGMINTYSGFLKNKIKYISDSNGYWRNNRLYDLINTGNNMVVQVLTHPVFWQKRVNYPKHKIWEVISRSAENKLKGYDELLFSFKRHNIGELSALIDNIKHIDKQTFFKIEKAWILKEYNEVILLSWMLLNKLLNRASSMKTVQSKRLVNSTFKKHKSYINLSDLIGQVLCGKKKLHAKEAYKTLTEIFKIIEEISLHK